MRKLADIEADMREMLKGLKFPQGSEKLEIPQIISQPPRMSHPDLHPDGTVKE